MSFIINNMEETKKEVAVDTKARWINSIALKFVQNKTLTPQELSFMQTMCSSEKNHSYGEFLKQLNVVLMGHPEFGSNPDTVIENFQRSIALGTNLYKATASGKRDDAAARSHNVSAINKYTKALAKYQTQQALEGHPSTQPIDEDLIDEAKK